MRRIKASWPRPQTPIVIATGGFAETMAPLCRTFDRVEPHLTLQGLQLAHALLRGPEARLVSRYVTISLADIVAALGGLDWRRLRGIDCGLLALLAVEC